MCSNILCFWTDFADLKRGQLLKLLTIDDNKNGSQYFLSIYFVLGAT